MSTKRRFLIGAVLLVGAVAYLIYAGVRQSAVYYFTIDEFLARRDSLGNQGIRVAGRVQEGSVTKSVTTAGTELTFRLGDFTGDGQPANGVTVPVHFVGVTPDMFKDGGGSDVIVEGKYRDGTIYAQSVLTSCPSKYEAEASQAAARN